MRLAETYRQTGLALGVFEKLAPPEKFATDQIHYDSRFSAFEGITLPGLLSREKEKLEEYISDSTIKRRKKHRQPDHP